MLLFRRASCRIAPLMSSLFKIDEGLLRYYSLAQTLGPSGSSLFGMNVSVVEVDRSLGQ